MTTKFLYSVVLGSLCLVSSTAVFSQNPSQSSITNTLNQTQLMQQTVEQESHLNKLTEDKWTEWGLTRQEWQHYETLMQGARGIWSPKIDPLTALGVEAKTEAERQRYAELLVKKEFKRVENEFAFQITYNKAFERLYPGILPFKTDDVSTTSAAAGRIVYFTRTDCEKCTENLTKLWSRAGNTPVDIYIVDSMQNDNKIRDWAIKNSIDIGKVKSRQITLNHDSGYWLHYANGKMPSAFLIQGDGRWEPVLY